MWWYLNFIPGTSKIIKTYLTCSHFLATSLLLPVLGFIDLQICISTNVPMPFFAYCIMFCKSIMLWKHSMSYVSINTNLLIYIKLFVFHSIDMVFFVICRESGFVTSVKRGHGTHMLTQMKGSSWQILGGSK